MHFIVKVFPEIIIKSPPVRKRFIKQLRDNLRLLLSPIGGIDVQRDWEKIEITAADTGLDSNTLAEREARVADVLSRTPGIALYASVTAYPLEDDLHSIYERTLPHWQQRLAGRTFCVRVKRSGQHSFSSTDVERYVGGGLAQHTDNAGVDLKNPDVTVRLEIKDGRLLVLSDQAQGLGGFPLGSQEAVLSLIRSGRTFCVRVKRSGQHSFSSTDVERYVGGGLAQHTDNAGVDLKNPDVTVRLEIKDGRLLVLSDQAQGLGGFPLGSQEAVLSLI